MQVKYKKPHTIEDLCPYPFHTRLHMPPFPQAYVIPTLPKYKGSGNLLQHERELSMALIEIENEPTYLMRLFP
jgi:hypothetical protein